LRADATESDIIKLCKEAKKYGFASVCVNPCWVQTCSDELFESGIGICTVIGFPLGASCSHIKEKEAEGALIDGATEIDMVINIGMLKSLPSVVLSEIRLVREHTRGEILKVIIETCLLTNAEKKLACELAKEARADFVKTSTGFSTGGATIHDVKLMRKTVGDVMGVKASGGIKDLKTAMAMIKAGANRLGCSAGVKIMKELEIEIDS
jgi:deoxyribose-phosphate aldolase